MTSLWPHALSSPLLTSASHNFTIIYFSIIPESTPILKKELFSLKMFLLATKLSIKKLHKDLIYIPYNHKYYLSSILHKKRDRKCSLKMKQYCMHVNFNNVVCKMKFNCTYLAVPLPRLHFRRSFPNF